MSQKINILPPAIFNLLAAGEVVENPAAVIKECVENSLDAGATTIEIAIERGGLDSMRITDNGSGVQTAQVDKVFLPHATSKIETAADLEKIGTLGFRGEALSSIAAVSKIEFVTRTNDEKTATKIEVEGGKVTNKSHVARGQGTTITISNLFFNTPARKKFLRPVYAEKNAVTDVIGRLILANPAVAFKYTVDGDIVFDYRGKTLPEAIAGVYGDDTAANLLSFKYGYVSKPTFAKRNRTSQTLIVNGRAVEGGIVADAVNAAFQNYMTVGNFPFFAVNLAVDLNDVDVNIHPRKAQIKFSCEQEIFDKVRLAVTEAVDAFLHDKHTNQFNQANDQELHQRIKHFSSAHTNAVKSAPHIMNKYDDIEQSRIARIAKNVPPPVQTQMTAVPDFNVIGTLFDTYILMTSNDTFFMLDQHAAHERLLYDNLKKQIDSGAVDIQRMLEPEIMVLNPQEMTKMTAAMPFLGAMGIECQPFGSNCFRVTAVPVLVLEHGISTLLENLLHDVKSTPPDKLSTLLQEKIIMQCCRNAVKAGQKLSNDQIDFFLKQFRQKVRPTCPHGRPIVVSYSKDQVEKLFSRK